MLGACLIQQGQQAVRTFSPMTAALRRRRDGLTQEGCRHGAIERTGCMGDIRYAAASGAAEA
jgi:hypothetical protein